MNGHTQHMNLPNHIAGVDDDDDPAAAGDSIDDQLVGYDEAQHAFEDGVGGIQRIDAGEALHSDGGYVHGDGGSDVFLQRGDGTNQLTLSFRGQVYVFDDVTPEKVGRFSSRIRVLIFGSEFFKSNILWASKQS